MSYLNIDKYLQDLCQKEGSDLHITAQKKNYFRIRKEIININDDMLLTNDDIVNWIKHAHSTNGKNLLEEHTEEYILGKRDLDFAYELQGKFTNYRFRVHAYSSGNKMSLAFRFIKDDIPVIEKLKLPSFYRNICNLSQGLVLVTGATGSGKSTTIASLINDINMRYKKHIVTIEDPIEYQFEELESLIHQREIGRDVPDIKTGVKSLFREDPDVILVGEIRDGYEMINALTLASSGHLVFATLHTSGVMHTIGRILSMMAGEDENMVRSLLQDNLKCIINQSLYKTNQNIVIPILEHLFTDQNTYRIFGGEMKDHQMKSILQTTSNADKNKMMFKWQSILNYYQSNTIDYQEAKSLVEIFDIDNIRSFEAQKDRR